MVILQKDIVVRAAMVTDVTLDTIWDPALYISMDILLKKLETRQLVVV